MIENIEIGKTYWFVENEWFTSETVTKIEKNVVHTRNEGGFMSQRLFKRVGFCSIEEAKEYVAYQYMLSGNIPSEHIRKLMVEEFPETLI